MRFSSHKPIQSIALFFVISTLIVSTGIGRPDSSPVPVYQNPACMTDFRIEDALARMTFEEKVALCHAQSKFSTKGVPRLGIPEIWMSDGPHGIRPELLWDEWRNAKWTNDSCTAFPALTCLAATWSPEMSALYGRSIGAEARYRKKDVLLGPGVNIYRTPLNGRNFEYMGEDPYLASVMVVPYIREVQKYGVAACVKHFALNNQEDNRYLIDVDVDDRTLYEIYLPAFKAAVQQGGAWAVMGAYNKYRGQYCCHNRRLLQKILRDEWNFDGVVISDWGGTHDTRESIENGLDIEMGTGTDGLTGTKKIPYSDYYLADPYLRLLRSGAADPKVLDDKVRRILRLVFRTNMNLSRPWGAFATEEHALAARRIAEEGIVLLKNAGGVLPFDTPCSRRILVVGENATHMMTPHGGSSTLKVKREVSPLEGIRNHFPSACVDYAQGYTSDVGQPEILAEEAVEAARQADIVIFVGGLNKEKGQDCEGADRKTYDLPYGQNALIEKLAAVNSCIVVVLISGNAVAMPWIERVPAVVEAWYGGSEAGNAIAAVLSGAVNPSGKLPFMFPVRLEDNPVHKFGDYPGIDNKTNYAEGIFVGYRWADKERIRPLFPFGHGLSYTTFEYTALRLDKHVISERDSLRVSLIVRNIGPRDGAEVVQVYVSDLKSTLPRPVKELKAFRKVWLQTGEARRLEFTLGRDALSYFDADRHTWSTEPGKFEILVGASSADIRAKATFILTGD